MVKTVLEQAYGIALTIALGVVSGLFALRVSGDPSASALVGVAVAFLGFALTKRKK